MRNVFWQNHATFHSIKEPGLSCQQMDHLFLHPWWSGLETDLINCEGNFFRRLKQIRKVFSTEYVALKNEGLITNMFMRILWIHSLDSILWVSRDKDPPLCSGADEGRSVSGCMGDRSHTNCRLGTSSNNEHLFNSEHSGGTNLYQGIAVLPIIQFNLNALCGQSFKHWNCASGIMLMSLFLIYAGEV